MNVEGIWLSFVYFIRIVQKGVRITRLPFQQLLEIVPFLAASGLPGFLAVTIVILTSCCSCEKGIGRMLGFSEFKETSRSMVNNPVTTPHFGTSIVLNECLIARS